MEANGNFSPDPALAAEALRAADLPLCTVLLRDEARYPWLVLVPRRANVAEPWDLLPGDRAAFWAEAERVGAGLKAVTGADKINLAAFGNVVRQLHLHVVARREGDPAWPGSVIGAPREPYERGGVPAFWPAFLDASGLADRSLVERPLPDRPVTDRQSP